MPGSSSLELSAGLEQRIRAASSVLRLSSEAFLARLLSQHYNTLGGLPRDLLRYILTFLDYSTISATITRVCRLWQDCVLEDPLHFFSRLRQVHGIHLLDPAHGLFYFPRALKRVMIESKSSTSSPVPTIAGAPVFSSTGSGAPTSAAAASASDTGGTRRAETQAVDDRIHLPNRAARQGEVSSASVIPASSFLTVDIRTQNTKSLPWGYVRETVQWAIAEERVVYGEVRTPALQQSEDPVWSQAATIAYDRRIYMFGGETYEGVVLDRAYEYNPMTKHWTVLPTLSEKRAAATAVAYKGYIFVFGGYNAEEGVLDTYEVMEVRTRTWISHLHPPQFLYKQQQQQRQKSQTDTLANARDAPEVAHQHSNAAHGDDERQTQNPLQSSGTAVANATWPLATAPQPGWNRRGHRTAVSREYRMPQKVCGTAVAVHGDVLLFAGGHQSRIAPEQTAVSYSAVNSTSTTPMHTMHGGADGGTGSDIATSTASTSVSHTHTPQSPRHVGSISAIGQVSAESFVWVFCPRTGEWWTQGPRLPSPRAFGAMTVLELPILGPCLCYFGGCAKADTPETAMLYIPLCTAAKTCVRADVDAKDGGDEALPTSPDTPLLPNSTVHRTQSKNWTVTQKDSTDAELRRTTEAYKPVSGTLRERAEVRGATRMSHRDASAAPDAAAGRDHAHLNASLRAADSAEARLARTAANGSENNNNCDTPLEQHQNIRQTCARDVGRPAAGVSPGDISCIHLHDDSAVPPGTETDTMMISRCFRNPSELPWQRYVRIPIGGAFTSVAVLGAPHSRSLVLTGFYPAPNIGYCKLDHLLPLDAFLPLLGVLSQVLTAQPEAAEAPPKDQHATCVHAGGSVSPSTAFLPLTTGGSPDVVASAAAAPAASTPMPQLDPCLQAEATVAVNHLHQEREWSHHQRQEIREMVRSAAHAATMRHPRNPQTAGEEHKWSLSPVPEVRVASRNSHSLLRVSWKVQTLNAKVIVGME